MAVRQNQIFDCKLFIAKHRNGTISRYGSRQTICAQGDPANAVFYIVSGSVEVHITSEFGKEGVIALLGAGTFFGEGCLATNPVRASGIVTASECEIARFDAAAVARAIRDDSDFAHTFLQFVLDQNESLKADLVDHLFNSSEHRLARTLVKLAHAGIEDQSTLIPVAINQQTLARMVGTTRSRINAFMNKFRKFGYIDYSNGPIEVRSSLMTYVAREQMLRDER